MNCAAYKNVIKCQWQFPKALDVVIIFGPALHNRKNWLTTTSQNNSCKPWQRLRGWAEGSLDFLAWKMTQTMMKNASEVEIFIIKMRQPRWYDAFLNHAWNTSQQASLLYCQVSCDSTLSFQVFLMKDISFSAGSRLISVTLILTVR